MGLGVQGAATNVSSSNKSVNAQVGPLATNTLEGMSQNLNDGVDNSAVPVHFQAQVAEAQAAAVGAQTVSNPVAANSVTTMPATGAPVATATQQAAMAPSAPVVPPSTAAFCVSCGTQLVAGAKFCAGCGQPCGVAEADMV